MVDNQELVKILRNYWIYWGFIGSGRIWV